MSLDLTDEQTALLEKELSRIIQNDRYPLSPRIVALKEILRKLRPEPEREPFPLAAGITSRRVSSEEGDGESEISVLRRGPV
jgi:hypothetical protein